MIDQQKVRIAWAYAARIKSDAKRAYAKNLLNAILNHSEEPYRGKCGFMAAQAVRNELYEILGITTEKHA